MGSVRTRQVVASDYDAVVEISSDVYSGNDYLIPVFLDWVVDPHRRVMGVEMNGKLVGLVSMWLMPRAQDSPKRILEQATRIHPAYRGQGLSNILKKVSDEQAAILGKDEYIICSVVNTTKIPFKAENMMTRDRAYVTARQQTVSLYKSEPQSFFTALERATANRRPMDRYRHVDAHAFHALLTNTPDDVPASQVTGRHLLMLDWIPYQMCLASLLYLENLGESVKFIAEIRPDGGLDGGECLASYSAAITRPVVGTRYVTVSTDFTQSGRALSSEQFLDLFTSYALMHKPSALAGEQWVYCYDYRGDSTQSDAEKNESALQQWLAANVEDEPVPCFLRRITMTSLERSCTIMTS